jgi:glutamate synthase (NADPH/NADH) large chain
MTAQQPGAVPFIPQAQGLFDPKREYDACGVGFIADLKGGKSHRLIEDALAILCNVEHRGAVGADPIAGDGAGILIQIPHEFLTEECTKLKINLPKPGHYAVGHLFMPQDERLRAHCERVWMRIIREEGLEFLGWRSVPTDNSCLSAMVKAVEPMHRQIFIGRPDSMADHQEFERRLYLIRKVVSNALYYAYKDRDIGHYTVSLSSRTLVYKGMFLSYQVQRYYKDLSDPRLASAMALVHQRFSTNTFPSWKLAHPYRMVAHNGEINTLRGNVNWMAARQASVATPLFGSDISKLWPISYEGQSDTACFDNALEFLVMGGYSLAHAAMMLIPEAWAGNPLMDAKRRAFYEYHACLMEPWDGPAAMAFTDGRQIGATLDRNGLRPARYLVTKDDRVIMSSEAGVLPVPEENIARKWRLQPGKMLLIDMEQGCIVHDDDLKADLASRYPYEQWLKRTQIQVGDLPLPKQNGARKRTNVALLDLQQMFGYTQESLKFLMAPMAHTGQEAVGSMGNDTPCIGALLQAQAAPHLLQAELRPGHQPAHRLDPRGAGDEPGLVHRAAAEPARPGGHCEAEAARGVPADPHQRGPGAHPAHRPRQGQPVLLGDHRHHLSGREGSRRHDTRARRGLRRGRGGGALARIQHHHPVRPRGGAGPRPDPVAARHLGCAPSPDPPGPAHARRPRG